ncbi:MAG: GIY-YIG nuclease family protein, partial [Kiritimatiellales bacterium]
PEQTYVGFSTDLKKRIKQHNEGGCPHTAKFKPWELIWYSAFPEKQRALDFEKHLKSHSGKAFASKRLIDRPL